MALNYLTGSLGYGVFHALGFPVLMPATLAVSVTHRCNARCKICRVYTRKKDELSTGEYRKIFKSISTTPEWVTLTGGEPFIRKDLNEITSMIAKYVEPGAITVATNGWYTDRVLRFVRDVVKEHDEIQFVLNVSLDAIGPTHDKLRGLEGCFDHARETFYQIREINETRNLHLGINTVVSRFNYEAVPDLIKYVSIMKPDAHVFEPAQRRGELRVENADLEPPIDAYRKIVEQVVQNASARKGGSRISRLIDNFRAEYYKLSIKIMQKGEQVIPCYAGIASAHVSPSGNVWSCCTLARSMGNLRDVDYNFDRVWRSREATRIRRYIKDNRCCCTMANAAYSNMIQHYPSLARAGTGYLLGK